MSLPLPNSPQATPRPATTGPSLHKLVRDLPDEQRLRQPADALVILGRQLELVLQTQSIAADVALGTLRFSLFRMHQGRIAQLAPLCRQITVYGEADVEPPSIPGVAFVALPTGSALGQEWFVTIDSAEFWAALVTQAVPERSNGKLRRYVFDGVLSGDERLVSRANLLLSLVSRRPVHDHGSRNAVAQRANWGRVAYELARHSEEERLGLLASLQSMPELMRFASQTKIGAPEAPAAALAALSDHYQLAGAAIYRLDQAQLVALAADGRLPHPRDHQAGLLGQALTQRQVMFGMLSDSERAEVGFAAANAATAVPLLVDGAVWGGLLIGHAESNAHESPASNAAIGVAAVLEQLLGGHAVPAPIVMPRDTPVASPPAPTPPMAVAPRVPENTPSAPNTNGAFGLPSWMRGGGVNPPPSLAAKEPNSVLATTPPAFEVGERSWSGMQKRMMGALVAFDQRGADLVWGEACSMYPTEAICTELLMPVQIAVGEGWHRGEVSVAAEHFCSRFVEGKLLNLLNAHTDNYAGPLAVIGCAQNELHELGAIMLSLFMRWSGFRVIYLGQNIPNSTIEETIRQLRPQVMGLSATTIEAAHSLTEVGHIISRIEPPRPLFIFGGMAFYERPDLRSRIHGQFLEGDVRQIVRDLAEQLKK